MREKFRNEFIKIYDRDLLCRILCEELNNSDWKFNLFGEDAQKYRIACRVVCDHLCDYMKGAEKITTPDDYFIRYGMTVPASRTYPEAVIEMIMNLKKDFDVDISSIIFSAAERTEAEKIRIHAEQIKKEKREQIVLKAMKGELFPDDVSEKIAMILRIQKEKSFSGKYLFSPVELDVENKVAQLWCHILISSLFDKELPFGLLKSLVEEHILDEGEATDLLREHGARGDWEEYSERYIGFDFLDSTIVKTSKVLALTEPLFMEILSIRNPKE